MTTGGKSGPVPGSASSPASAARAVVELARPLNGAIAAGAVLVGAFVARRPVLLSPAILGALAAFAAAASANAANDIVDREIDAVNRPGRPIPSGRIGPGAAKSAALLWQAAALVLSALVGGEAFALVASWAVVTTIYSAYLKAVPVTGTVLAALVGASPFLMGGITQGRIALSAVPFALAFVVHAARELVKDAEDVEGDARAGVRTLAVALGRDAAVLAARLIVIVLMPLAVLPFVLGLFGWGYVAVVAVIEGVLAWLAVSMGGPSEPARLRLWSNGFKAVMVLGLAAFALGVI
jgi:geranylgeranylglycerol-phosphate geranylgeranyltransferase